MHILAPQGWEKSPYYRLLHPTLEQQYQEALDWHENLKGGGQKKKEEEKSPPTLEEIKEKYEEKPCYPFDELIQMLGECVWNIFSNNHTVVGPEGEEYDLGSFRGSGGFIADFINEHYPSERISYDYMDFYCAGWHHHRRADLTAVYALLFRRLREKHFDWIYSFPRTYHIDLSHFKDEQPDEPTEYDPEKAMQDELEKEEQQRQLADLQRSLDEAYEEAKEAAKYNPPPEIIQAYRELYGRFPDGWVV
jgi:hypothetical protein